MWMLTAALKIISKPLLLLSCLPLSPTMQLYWFSHLSLSLSLTTTWVASKSTISLLLIMFSFHPDSSFLHKSLSIFNQIEWHLHKIEARRIKKKIKLHIWFKPLAFGCNGIRLSILDVDNHFKLCFMLQDAAGFLKCIYSWKGNICGHRRMERERLLALFPSSSLNAKIYFL